MKIIIVLFFSSLFVSCVAQKPEGLYFDDQSTSFACIKNDSIAIGFKRSENDGLRYFYGTYTPNHDTIILGENLLRHENAIVDTMYTEYQGIEIQLYELFHGFNMGAPTEHDTIYYKLTEDSRVWWDYKFDSIGWVFSHNKPKAKSIDGIIQIPILITPIKNEFLIKGYVFFTEQILEIKPNTRYVIKQKEQKVYNQNQRPMVPQEVPIVYNPKKNQIEIMDNTSVSNQPYSTFQLKHIGKGVSCLGELRKRHPDL